jgi:hypothetical protein
MEDECRHVNARCMYWFETGEDAYPVWHWCPYCGAARIDDKWILPKRNLKDG